MKEDFTCLKNLKKIILPSSYFFINIFRDEERIFISHPPFDDVEIEIDEIAKRMNDKRNKMIEENNKKKGQNEDDFEIVKQVNKNGFIIEKKVYKNDNGDLLETKDKLMDIDIISGETPASMNSDVLIQADVRDSKKNAKDAERILKWRHMCDVSQVKKRLTDKAKWKHVLLY